MPQPHSTTPSRSFRRRLYVPPARRAIEREETFDDLPASEREQTDPPSADPERSYEGPATRP